MSEETLPALTHGSDQRQGLQATTYADPAEEDLEYPIPFSQEKAEQWAKEDPGFSIEEYRRDPYFTKENQADLRRAIAEMEAGEYTECVRINGEWVEVDAN